jgi:hypothetical protein
MRPRKLKVVKKKTVKKVDNWQYDGKCTKNCYTCLYTYYSSMSDTCKSCVFNIQQKKDIL